MNEKEKENVKEVEEEEEEEEEEGIQVREQRKGKRKRSRRRRRREEQEFADRPDLAPTSDRGQRQWAKVKGQTFVIFFFSAGASKPHWSYVEEAKKKKTKKKKRTLARHRNLASRNMYRCLIPTRRQKWRVRATQLPCQIDL